uniref:Ig-like domain-containing protein n=1 Tax=Anser cygnoides TaxID=8845 RepID=A0A8B9EDH9_ANSCY
MQCFSNIRFLPQFPHDVCDCLLQGTFLIHMASSCLLAANGSVMGFDFTLAFNKNQLVCYESDTQCFVACDWGLLRLQATHLAAHLNNDSTWVQRVEAQRQACSDLALRYWDWTALRRTQPQVRIIPAETGNARVPVCLTCHIWGFYPPEETVIWLRNRDILEPDGYNPISAIPNGNWTYQTQVARPPAPGYTPLPGENYPKGNSVPIPVHIGESRITPSLALSVPLPQAASEDPQTDTSWHLWLLDGPISDPMLRY